MEPKCHGKLKTSFCTKDGLEDFILNNNYAILKVVCWNGLQPAVQNLHVFFPSFDMLYLKKSFDVWLTLIQH